MTLYIVLFLFGFILAVGLLAYSSMKVAELSKKTESFGQNLIERYSKPLKELTEAEAKEAREALEDKKEKKEEKEENDEDEI